MKPLSVAELQNLALELKTLEGARLQEIRLSPPLFLLGLYCSGSLHWLGFDLHPNAPQVLGFESLQGLKLKDEKKPLVLFMKAHFVDLRLKEVVAPLDLGRVLLLRFGIDTSRGHAELEVRLFPRGPNILARAEGKELALVKPSPLKPLETPPEWSGETHEGLLLEKTTLWRGEREGAVEGATAKGDAGSAKAEAKILKALGKAEADLDVKRGLRWADAGEWLKTNSVVAADFMASAPEDLREYLDGDKGFSWNLENCFTKAKELKDKIAGSEKRLRLLRDDLDKIRGGQNIQKKEGEFKSPSARSGREDIKGRTYELGNGIIFFVGKSAQDNLRLLRAAKAWDLWLHLRDVPSCHGILRRNKNQTVSDAQLHQAAHHLITKNFGDKHKNHEGDRFDILVAECRFVRPIKGDKTGRVTYSDERVFAHRYSKKS